jgi:hypothetical protein
MAKIIDDIFDWTPLYIWCAFLTFVINKAGRMWLPGFIRPEWQINILILIACALLGMVLGCLLYLAWEEY